jgi:DNA-binding SARP family transcriptional activator/WD40 repeat protein
MGIGVLGTLTVDDEPVSLSPRDRVVLSALAARPGRVVSRDTLGEALWGGSPPASSAKVLQGCISRIRRLLGTHAVETAPPGYRLALPEEDVDAVRFERTVARARDLAALGQVDRAGHLVDDTLALWRGRPLPDLEDWESGRVEADRLEELRREAEELRVDCYLRAGRHHEVLADAAALVREEPTREARWALLARAQYQDGSQAEALATLQQARELLADELGLDPGRALTQLQELVLRQDPSLLPEAGTTRTPDHCPYRGLAAYDVGDAETFFGRDSEVAACLRLLSDQGVLAVVGPSGSGESSLVRAGVAAALTRRGTRVRVITPGDAPVRALEALPRRSRRETLVVDQCEEAFSQAVGEAQRSEFLDRLADHAGRAPLVVALRADRLADVARHPAFARLLERGLHLLGGMDEPSLREAIETPARQAGLILEPGLVDLLLREVEGEPGALPLLSHALQETWLRREGSTLTVAGYRSTGGIRGAVAQTAEQVYENVDPTQRHLMRELMIRLVSAGTRGEPSRVRAPRTRVIVEPAQERLVDDLVAARLLTSEEGLIEIAHESLARAWPRLTDWLDEDVEGQRILHHVTSAADAWESLGRPDSELYRGARLQQALAWRDRAQVELTPVEEEFLEAARRATEAEEQALVERARHQAALIRRQRVALVSGAVALALALAAGGVALRQSDRAQAGEEAALASERVAQAGRIGARALTVEDPSTALLLGVEAVRTDDNPQTRRYLREAMARRPALVASTEETEEPLLGLSVNAERNDVVAYGFDNTVHRFDLASGEHVAEYDLDGPEAARRSLFETGELVGTDDGSMVAVGQNNFVDPAVLLLDRETLRPLPEQLTGLPVRGAKVGGLDVSADGRWLAATLVLTTPDPAPSLDTDFVDFYALVWDLSRPARQPWKLPLPPMSNGWSRARISEDGRTLFVGTPPRAYRVRGRGARELWRRADLISFGGSRIDLSPDGRRLAVGYDDSAFVLDTRTGRTVAHLGAGEGVSWVADVQFSPDGTRLAAADGRRLHVWDVATGETLLRADQGTLVTLDYSSDDDVVHLTGDHGVETWDVAGDRRFITRRATTTHVDDGVGLNIIPSVDGSHYAELVKNGDPYGGGPSDVRLVDIATGTAVRRATIGFMNLPVGSWHPDGTTYVAGTPAGEVVSVPLRGPVGRFRASEVDLVAAEYAPDGKHVVVLDEDSRVRRFTAGGGAAGPSVRLPASGKALAVAPDSRTAIVLVADPPLGPQESSPADRWVLVDVVGGRVLRTGELPPSENEYGWEAVHFPPDSADRVALSGWGGVQVLDLGAERPASGRVAAHTEFAYGDYTADGSLVVSGGENGPDWGGDGRVVLWDGKDGTVVDVAMIEPELWFKPVMLPDGHTVLAIGPESIHRWDTRINRALDAACRAAGRSMTQVEWRTKVGDDLPYHATCG